MTFGGTGHESLLPIQLVSVAVTAHLSEVPVRGHDHRPVRLCALHDVCNPVKDEDRLAVAGVHRESNKALPLISDHRTRRRLAARNGDKQ